MCGNVSSTNPDSTSSQKASPFTFEVTADQDVLTTARYQDQATHADGVKAGYTRAVIDNILNNLYDNEFFDEDGIFVLRAYQYDVQVLKLALDRLRHDVTSGRVSSYDLLDEAWISEKIAR